MKKITNFKTMQFEDKKQGFGFPKSPRDKPFQKSPRDKPREENFSKEIQKAVHEQNSSDKLLKDNALNDNIEKTVQTYHRYLIVINMFLVLFNVMFTEYLW